MSRAPSGTPSWRPVEDQDADFLLELYRLTHGAHLGHLPEPMRGSLVAMQARAQLDQHRARFPRLEARVLLQGGVPVGRLLWSPGEGSTDPVYAVDLAIHPRAQRQGLGSAVLAGLREEVRPRAVRLQVARSNPRARALYLRLGFVDVDGTETHHGMVWAGLPQVAG